MSINKDASIRKIKITTFKESTIFDILNLLNTMQLTASTHDAHFINIINKNK